MEDLKKLDDEIVKAAEAYDEAWLAGALQPSIEGRRLHAAICAKREASRPKLLSAEEAVNLYWGPAATPTPRICEIMQAVLDADRASILKVVEEIQKSGNVRRHADLCQMRPGDDNCSCGGLIALSDIRSALSTRSS